MDNLIKRGCLDIWIDELVPCLKDAETGEDLDTVAFKIESRSYLTRFREDNGWKIDWVKIPKDVEVYAIALADTNEIQGIIGIKDDKDADAVYIHWACAAPQNNKNDFGTQKYLGVGGHLIAIATEKSYEYGHDGVTYGFAANSKLVEHYVDKLFAQHIPARHVYQVIFDEKSATKLKEVYEKAHPRANV